MLEHGSPENRPPPGCLAHLPEPIFLFLLPGILGAYGVSWIWAVASAVFWSIIAKPPHVRKVHIAMATEKYGSPLGAILNFVQPAVMLGALAFGIHWTAEKIF